MSKNYHPIVSLRRTAIYAFAPWLDYLRTQWPVYLPICIFEIMGLTIPYNPNAEDFSLGFSLYIMTRLVIYVLFAGYNYMFFMSKLTGRPTEADALLKLLHVQAVKLLLANALLVILCLLGLVFLVLPGIILYMLTIYTLVIVVVEHVEPADAIKQSVEMGLDTKIRTLFISVLVAGGLLFRVLLHDSFIFLGAGKDLAYISQAIVMVLLFPFGHIFFIIWYLDNKDYVNTLKQRTRLSLPR